MTNYIYGKWFDLSNFHHPGGNDWIHLLPKGVDMSPILESYHRDSFTKMNLLSKYEVESNKDVILSGLDSRGEFYIQLKRRVDKFLMINKYIVDSTKFIYLLLFWVILSFYLLFVYVSYFTQFSPFFSILILGITRAILGGYGHNFIHQSKWLHNLSFVSSFAGYSPYEWETRHNYQHHPFTNINSLDPDYEDIKQLYSLPRLIRFIVIFPVNIIKFFTNLYKQPWNRIHYNLSRITILFELFLFYTNPFIWVFTCFITTYYFISINIATHYLHSSDDDVQTNDWGIHQILSSRNVSFLGNNVYDSIFTLGLGYHTHHHLFPNLHHGILPLITPIIHQTCKDFGVQIHEPKGISIFFKVFYRLMIEK